MFGSGFLIHFKHHFMPTNEPNLDSSYTLDVGDVLNIQVIGQMDYDEEFFLLMVMVLLISLILEKFHLLD